jgi:hypothetical protein
MDRRLLIVTLALATGWFAVGPLAAARAAEPVQVAKLPFLEIFSPTFFWSDEADVVRTGSTNCPKGRAIAGGLSIQQGQASLRILESYPDGESWMMRVVNRKSPTTCSRCKSAALRCACYRRRARHRFNCRSKPSCCTYRAASDCRPALSARVDAKLAHKVRSSCPADLVSTPSTKDRRCRASN